MIFFTPGEKPFRFWIENEWWHEAGMDQFKPSTKHYAVLDGRPFKIVPLAQIRPPERIFRVRGFEMDKMVSILQAFKNLVPLKPIKGTGNTEGKNDFLYEVQDGYHRFFASVAVGFEEIAVVKIGEL